MIIEKMLLCMCLQLKESALSQFVGLRFGGILAKGKKKGLS